MRGAGTCSDTLAGRRVTRAAEAREDLPAHRVVPVAERRPAGRGVGRPRTTAKDAIVRPEEHLGVLLVGERPEAGIARERAGGPLPHIAYQLARAIGRGTGWERSG